MVVEAPDAQEAEKQVEELCRRFLTNPVIEDSVVSIGDVRETTAS